ncbi:hypothetical protein [Natronobacterium texcoconense]|uniref:Uncharacterized protein n=1 Tax=Natronobacterium texcoconense TaxID=1095778 RepID=A0A1H1BE77_NATTX|nr:hypothetical protein [Natronobacterium texcoconense]SDQ50100.1 hypothetical protein SAMN04489842_1013 [Natronobacterium texcoconense]
MTPSRRELLAIAGTTATMTAVGGWQTVAAQETDDLPEYSQWLTIDDDGLEFVYVDWANIGDEVITDLEEAEPDEEVPEEYEEDPMVAPASEGLLEAYFFLGVDLAQYRLGRLLDAEGDFESTVEGLLRTTDAFVVTGDIQPEEIDDQLTAEAEIEFFRQLERTDEIGEFDVYTPVEGNDAAVAVSTDALVVANGEDDAPEATLETLVDAWEGDLEQATEESESFAWLLETAGDGDVVVGQYGDRVAATDDALVDMAFAELEDAEGIVSSITAENEDTASGEFAAIIDGPDEDALGERLGASADQRSITIVNDQVVAAGTWREVE